MKQFYRFTMLFVAFWGLQFAGTAQTIYVKSNASGSNNGSSWANAYTSLDAALAAANSGNQVWVAAGTYKPGTGPNSSFLVLSGVELYGGFAGTETSLSQRNISANSTVLNGDLNGNDIQDSLTLNKSDNSFHVVEVGGDATKRSVIDGFIIRNGTTKLADADPDLTKRGGGLQATTPVTVRNCRFTQNTAYTGGGMAVLDADAGGLVVENCLFENNLGTSQCAGMYMRTLEDATVKNCIFRNNSTTRGSLYPQYCQGVTIDSCLFDGNKTFAASQFGAGMFTWQSSFIVKNSIFRNNTASTAAGMYNDGREGGNSFIIDNCLFENNTSNGAGGGMYNWQANFVVKNCVFRNNKGASSAGMYNDGRENSSSFSVQNTLFEGNNAVSSVGPAVWNNRTEATFTDCQFKTNICTSSGGAIYNGNSKNTYQNCLFDGNQGAFGGSMANYGVDVHTKLIGCTFTTNKATTSGGAVTNGFLAQVEVENCHFEGNNARFGGAIFNQNDSTALTVKGSLFKENNADNQGGAVNVSAGIKANFSNSQFIANSANYGAALEISEDSLDLSETTIHRCVFRDNLAFTQGAAVNIDNADVTITSTLFGGNTNFGTGAGGAISSNGADGKTVRLFTTNCTYVNNTAPLGAGIAQFAADASFAEMTVQNCIFSNIGANYEIESGTPTVTSKGGNLSSDNTLEPYGNGALDQHNGDPLFVDDANFDFHLKPNSPCINKGVAAGAPATDLDGLLFNGLPDIGCYEFDGITGTQQPLAALALELMPNPATEFVRTTIHENWTGKVLVRIFNAEGRLAGQTTAEKSAEELNLLVPVKNLASGAYTLVVSGGPRLYSGRFVKE